MAEVFSPFGRREMLKVTCIHAISPRVLRATFDDGAVRDVDFSQLIQKGGVSKTLAFLKSLADVAIVHDGRAVRRANGVDFCVDALRIRGDEQLNSKEKTDA